LHALSNLPRVSLVVLLVGIWSSALGQRSIDCAAPPGGRITCEEKQAAICNVDKGAVLGVCETPQGKSKLEIDIWFLKLIYGQDVSPVEYRDQYQGNKRFQDMLKSGRIDGTNIRFSLPYPTESSPPDRPTDSTRPTRPSPSDDPRKPSTQTGAPKDPTGKRPPLREEDEERRNVPAAPFEVRYDSLLLFSGRHEQ